MANGVSNALRCLVGVEDKKKWELLPVSAITFWLSVGGPFVFGGDFICEKEAEDLR